MGVVESWFLFQKKLIKQFCFDAKGYIKFAKNVVSEIEIFIKLNKGMDFQITKQFRWIEDTT